MLGRLLPALALGLALSGSGCVTSDDLPTYVVRFTLENTSSRTLEVSDYPHCGTASLHDEHVLVQSPKPRGKAVVYIEPEFASTGEGFVSLGNEPMARGLDPLALVPDGLRETEEPILTLELEGGALLIDGVQQPLPYHGTSRHAGGLWTATFTVEEGPRKVRVDHQEYSCA